eukprot:TRINITY_DN57211_c0_g1_i1.p1 TRINITY_DN57211_c0_g1~~TRINITY_DN57211_c0_g1_i1.p1  ORF type:complete len:1155 (+),score=220.20 TRINITY_DN57211_c0_g1_i1:93-3557(+)
MVEVPATATEVAKLGELLAALLSSNNTQRRQAESVYQKAKISAPDGLLLGIVALLRETQLTEPIRRQAAVLLRSLVTVGSPNFFVFPRLSRPQQQQFAAELLRSFEAETSPGLQQQIGSVVSKLAEFVCDPNDPRGSLEPNAPVGWPALLPMVFRLSDASNHHSVGSCESALWLMKDLVWALKDEIMAAHCDIERIFQAGLSHADSNIRTAALTVICEIVKESDKKTWAPLAVTAESLLQVVAQLKRDGCDGLLQYALQAFIDVASAEPDFFKMLLVQRLEPASLFAELARTREGLDSGVRGQALEWLIVFAENRARWLMKHVPGFAQLALDVCMQMMLEVDDGEAELAAWAQRSHNEEGEEDVDEVFHAGEEAIDRLVRALQAEAVWQPFCLQLHRFAQMPCWRARHAALAAIRQTAEHLEEMAASGETLNLVLQHFEHPHARVRYAAVHAIGQIANDFTPHFQESSHATVMPALLLRMDDPVERVVVMAMMAFVSFGETLDRVLMLSYAHHFTRKFVQMLQSTQSGSLREESITCIAVVAEVLGDDFSQYYDGIMPMLKHFVMHATEAKQSRLRGKSFECMSFLGIAVGKDRFLPDAKEAVAEMMGTPLAADDVQREYIKQAAERICHCLKKDFVPFLPALLPGIFAPLKLDNVSDVPQQGQDEDEYEYTRLTTNSGKCVAVRTQQFEEMLQSVQLLHTIVFELEGAFFDWVPATAEALLPLLSTTEEVSPACDMAWSLALQTWALLIKIASQRCPAHNGQVASGGANDLSGKLLRACLQNAFAAVDKSKDGEVISGILAGVSACIRNAGPRVFEREEIIQLVGKIFALIDQSFRRTAKQESLRQQEELSKVDLPEELRAEDEEDANEDEEDGCRQSCEDVLGAVMQVCPVEFQACFPDCASRVTTWLSVERDTVLGLNLACDLLRHLPEEQSATVWPAVLPVALRRLRDDQRRPDARAAAASVVQLASPLPGFAAVAPDSFRCLVNALANVPSEKRRAVCARIRTAHTRAVAALVHLARLHPGACPPDVQIWPLVASHLPVRGNEEQARQVHAAVTDLLLERGFSVFGQKGCAEGAAVAASSGSSAEESKTVYGLLLGALAEVRGDSSLCDEATETNILEVFRQAPREELQALASGFSEKQRRKIERMLGA